MNPATPFLLFVATASLWYLSLFLGPKPYRYAMAKFFRRFANAVSPDRF